MCHLECLNAYHKAAHQLAERTNSHPAIAKRIHAPVATFYLESFIIEWLKMGGAAFTPDTTRARNESLEHATLHAPLVFTEARRFAGIIFARVMQGNSWKSVRGLVQSLCNCHYTGLALLRIVAAPQTQET